MVVCGFQGTQAEQIVGRVSGGLVWRDSADEERDACVVTEIEAGGTFGRRKALEGLRARFGQVKRGQRGGRSGGQPRTIQPRVGQSKIVPHYGVASVYRDCW